MLPIDRQKNILTWLEQEGSLKVAELSKRLDVSEMTVYRDAKPLIEKKVVAKISGGLSFIPKVANSSNECGFCYKEIKTRHAVKIIKSNQEMELLCCSHCGLLRYADIEEKVSHIICRDFLHDTTISAKMAYYLIGATLNMNCCQPQAITFESKNEVDLFQKGFGGEIYSFDEAIKEIKQRMNPSCCHSKE
jgi:DeoR/GlpR family transcriptional regulator of sugar metabolism